jgi:hypothetical protein
VECASQSDGLGGGRVGIAGIAEIARRRRDRKGKTITTDTRQSRDRSTRMALIGMGQESTEAGSGSPESETKAKFGTTAEGGGATREWREQQLRKMEWMARS